MRLSHILLSLSILLIQYNYTQVKINATPESSCNCSSVTLSIANPPTDCDNYSISDITFSPHTITGVATTVSLSDDTVSGDLPIGFDFNFCLNS